MKLSVLFLLLAGSFPLFPWSQPDESLKHKIFKNRVLEKADVAYAKYYFSNYPVDKNDIQAVQQALLRARGQLVANERTFGEKLWLASSAILGIVAPLLIISGIGWLNSRDCDRTNSSGNLDYDHQWGAGEVTVGILSAGGAVHNFVRGYNKKPTKEYCERLEQIIKITQILKK